MKGLVTLDIYKKVKGKERNKTIKGYNTISNGALAFIGANGTFPLVAGNSNFAGDRLTKTSVNKQYYHDTSSGGYSYNFMHESDALHCCLIGLQSSVYDNIDSSKSFLPILNSDGTVNQDAIRAKASMKSTADSYIGTAASQKGTSVVDNTRIGKRYSFPSGTGSGSVSGIAMLPGGYTPNKIPHGGFITYTKMEDVDAFIDRASGASKVVMPGVDGLGFAIGMLYTTHDNVVSHTRNLVTGEVVDGTSNDWFPYFADENYQYDDGQYIYTAVKNSDYYLLKYDKLNSYNRSSVVSIPKGYRYGGDYGLISLYIHNGNPILFVGNPTSGDYYVASYAGPGISATYKSTKSDLASALENTFGITVPSAWVTDNDVKTFIPVTVGNYTGLIVVVGDNSHECYIFSDKTNVIGSLIAIIPCLDKSDYIFGYQNTYGVYRQAKNKYLMQSISRTQQGYVASPETYKNMDTYSGTSNNFIVSYAGAYKLISTSSESYLENSGSYGTFISLPGQFATWLSIKELDEVQNKSSETDMFVQYDYKFDSVGHTADTLPTGTQSTSRTNQT